MKKCEKVYCLQQEQHKNVDFGVEWTAKKEIKVHNMSVPSICVLPIYHDINAMCIEDLITVQTVQLSLWKETWFKHQDETRLIITTWISVVTLVPWWNVFSTHDFTTLLWKTVCLRWDDAVVMDSLIWNTWTRQGEKMRWREDSQGGNWFSFQNEKFTTAMPVVRKWLLPCE